MNNSIRIIGGLYRGKKISFPTILGLRPTPDRVRETLFNWLAPVVRNARCLDAFAGSGALGFEAFSRGAAQVDFFEKNAVACRSLQEIIPSLNTKKLSVSNRDALGYLEKNTQLYDIIFLDPPFDQVALSQCFSCIEANASLSKNGIIYTESAAPFTPDGLHWETFKSKKAGSVFYALHRRVG